MTVTDLDVLVSWLRANGFAFEGHLGCSETPSYYSGYVRVAIEDNRVLIYAFDKPLPDCRARNLWGATFANAPLRAITCSIDAAANAAIAEMMPT